MYPVTNYCNYSYFNIFVFNFKLVLNDLHTTITILENINSTIYLPVSFTDSYIYVGGTAGCSLQLFLVKWGLRPVLPNQMVPLAVFCIQMEPLVVA